MRTLWFLTLLLPALSAAAGANDELTDATAALRSPWAVVREQAVATLGHAGKRALPHVLPLLADADARVRRLAATAAAATKRPEAQSALLVRLVEEPDERVFEHVARAMVAFDREAWEVICQRAALSSATPRDRRAYDVFLWQYVIKTIHVILEENTNSVGDFKGFYDGQFHRLVTIGSETADVLAEMMRDQGRFPVTIRQIAVRALAEVGEERHLDALRLFHDELDRRMDREDPLRPDSSPDAILRSYARYVLARRGVVAPSHAHIRMWSSNRDHFRRIGKAPYAALYQWHIAYEYHQVRDFPQAIVEYRRYLDDYPPKNLKFGNTRHLAWYNLCCIESLRAAGLEGAAKAEMQTQAIRYLEQAFEDNYTDFGWVQVDRDLNAIRDCAAFKSLIERVRARYRAPDVPPPARK